MDGKAGIAAQWTIVPAVHDACCQLGGSPWTVRCIEDLSASLLEPSGHELNTAAHDALEPLTRLTPPRPWRTVIDVSGVLLSCAIDAKRRLVVLGSPRFASEAAVVGACRESVDDSHGRARLADLEALVDMHARASAEAAPADLEILSSANGLTVTTPAGKVLALDDAPLIKDIEAMAGRLDLLVRAYRPSARENFSQWGLELTSQYTALRLHLLRFVAALPSLDHDRDGAEVVRLLREAIRRLKQDDAQAASEPGQPSLPTILRMAVHIAHKLVHILPYRGLARLTRAAVRNLATTFIAGEDMADAAPSLAALRASGRDATLDQLGELVVSEREADVYRDRVLELIRASGEIGKAPQRNGAGIERGHVSIKVSALCSDYDGDDPDGTWRRVGPRLIALCQEAKARGVFINFDAEHYHVRDLTLEMFRRVLAQPDLAAWSGAGIVVQAYLRDSEKHLRQVLDLCQERHARHEVRTPIRLVKGAYWDAETIEGAAHDFPAPQLLNKPETDAMFQWLCLQILAAGAPTQLCVGSHNLRDHCMAQAARDRYFPVSPQVEHQALHMTYEGLSTAMAKLGWAVRNYIPVGSLLVGMAYLVRRILENSSQVGVLTMARHGIALDELLATPQLQLDQLASQGSLERDPQSVAALATQIPPFYNTPPLRLYVPAHRAVFEEALQASLEPWHVAGTPERRGTRVEVHSPGHPDRLVGSLNTSDSNDVSEAIARAVATARRWEETPVGERAAVLIRGAERMRQQRPHWAALIIRESGKSRAEALGDVDEAIDFMQFYAREALRIAQHWPTFRPRGPIAVVCPWNFPLAIPVGMACAALVMGNPVLLKSAEQTPLVVERWVLLLRELGVPAGALQHLVGDGPQVGAPLTADSRVQGVVFTGSRAVGTRLHRLLAARPCGEHAALAITEMGGKNAIVVTANADLDEAVSGALRSAFGHAGQKCSAASRVLVDRRIAKPFLARFCEAARDLQVGPSELPGTRVNPVVSAEDRDRLRQAARDLRSEAEAYGGTVHVDRSTPDSSAGPGYMVGPVVVELQLQRAMQAESWAQQELFGPIVHVIPFDSDAEAVQLWRAPEYALTGGIFAQSQDDIDRLTAAARVGNLYINRTITGARVAVEPFGGFQMSGTGPKAGGRDYLTSFITLPIEASPGLDEETCVLLSSPAANGAAHHGDDHGHAQPHAHATPLPEPDLEAGLRLASSWAALGEAWPGLASRCQGDLTALLQWAVKQLPVISQGGEANRVIPGQQSYNRWALPKGLTVVVAGSREPTRHAVLHAVASALCGNPLWVLACSDSAAEAWRGVVEHNGPNHRLKLQRVANRSELEALLADPKIASVIVDGKASDWAPLLDAMVQTPPGARHLRALHCPGAWPPPDRPEALVHAYLHVTSLAVNTMRHGASLEVAAVPGLNAAGAH